MELLTELLELPGCFVKEIPRRGKDIILTVESAGYPGCPQCGQANLRTTKDRHYQVVEDVSVFGKIFCFDHIHITQHFSKSIDKLQVRVVKRANKENK